MPYIELFKGRRGTNRKKNERNEQCLQKYVVTL